MQSGRRKLLIVGGVVLGALLIVTVSTKLTTKKTPGADDACRALFTAISKKDVNGSYNMLSSNLKSTTSKQNWTDIVGSQFLLFSNANLKVSKQQNLSESTDSSGKAVKLDSKQPVRWLLTYSLDNPAATATVHCTVSVAKAGNSIEGLDVAPKPKESH